MTVRGNAIHAEGALRLESQGDIRIEAARQTEQLASASKTSSRGLLSKTTEIRRHQHDYDLAVGSQIDAKTLVMTTQQGDVNIVGSDVVGEERTLIQAKNISIVEAENRVNEENVSQTKKSGLMKGGSFVFSIGSRQTTLESDNSKYYARGSQVGSLSGDTLMLADNAYLQRGSAVTSVEGNLSAQKGNAERKQVVNQSGLFAEEHYDVEADNVHLKGGAITGNDTAKNRLATNRFTFEDIQNSSESQAMSAGLNGSAGREKATENNTNNNNANNNDTTVAAKV